jgi:titin
MQYWLQALLISPIFFILSCSSDSNNTSSTPPTIINVEGVWTITETSIEGCPEWETDQYDLRVIQDGTNINIEDDAGNVFSGILDELKMSWSGSYIEPSPSNVPGITTITLMTTTITPDCNTLTGVSSWTWNATDSSGETCSAKSSFNGIRTPASGCSFDVSPVAPSGLSASTTSSDSIFLTWNDNSNIEDSFIVESSAASNNQYSLITTLMANTTSFSHTGLNDTTTYYYRVYAHNDHGDSDFSNEAFATTYEPPVVAPSAPENLTATPITSDSISLSWVDTSNDETGFIVERSLTSGTGFIQIGALRAGATGMTDTGLNPLTTYFYRVYAYNDLDKSEYSNESNATTLAPIGPAAPENLTATPISSDSISLSWVDKSSDETTFTVQRSLASGTGYSTIATLRADATGFIDTGLSPSTTYFYRVYASNNDGDSDYSNETYATTL